jgi:pilus assembly protein CpaB
MGRRTVLLIAALVVAALGTALVFLYVTNYTGDIDEGNELVKVLQAQQQVDAGTTASQASEDGAFVLVELPQSAVPDGALSDISPVSEQVALAPIFEGQQILTQMFGTQLDTGGLNVPKDQLAISVQLGDPNRVAGFVQPGSKVAVFSTIDGTDGDSETRILLTSADGIGVRATTGVTQTTTDETGESTTEEIPRAILTLALDQQDAQRVIFAQEQGPLYFGLLPEDANVRDGQPTTSQNLFN